MDAVIVTSGKSHDTLVHLLNNLPPHVDRFLLVAGERQASVRGIIGDEWDGIPVVYAPEDPKSLLRGDRYLVVSGDEWHSAEALAELAARVILSPCQCVLPVKRSAPPLAA
ncbi:MAG TPA: hypothetical protein VMU11_00030 [Verrucomicrobiae bacterium]|nr:hypothetical protein [Verrucomicrobiae bacterium]